MSKLQEQSTDTRRRRGGYSKTGKRNGIYNPREVIVDKNDFRQKRNSAKTEFRKNKTCQIFGEFRCSEVASLIMVNKKS